MTVEGIEMTVGVAGMTVEGTEMAVGVAGMTVGETGMTKKLNGQIGNAAAGASGVDQPPPFDYNYGN